MIKFERNFKPLDRVIPADLHEQINKGIDLIAKDIQNGIEGGAQFGKRFTPNSPTTEKSKGFNHPLKATGLMMDKDRMIKTRATKQKQEGTLRPNEERIDIGFYHNEGKGVPLRPWFGISADAERKVMTKIEKSFDRAINRL